MAPSPGSDGPTPGDLALGAFSDTPPWQVVPDAMRWRDRVEALRAETANQVPALLRRRRLPPVRPAARLAVHLVPAVAGWYLIDRPRARRRDDPSASKAGLSRRLRRAFERLGPTYIKLGQIISSGEGLFPAELVHEFRLLRDRVPAEPFEAVRQVVEADLGRPLDAVFSSFEELPLAAASIAQVHAAVLRSGEGVVVKVQRPTVAAAVREDLAAMSW